MGGQGQQNINYVMMQLLLSQSGLPLRMFATIWKWFWWRSDEGHQKMQLNDSLQADEQNRGLAWKHICPAFYIEEHL